MKKMKVFLWVFGVLVFFAGSNQAKAFEISPVKALLTVSQGASQTIVVKIKNSQALGNSTNFKLSVLGMKQDEDGKPVFSRGINIAENWVYPEENLLSIKSDESGSANFIIKIPDDAQAGSYYLGLAAEPVLEKNNLSPQQSGLSVRLVSLLTLEVKGLVQESLAIEKWTANFADQDQNKKIKFDLNIKNSGTIETAMRGAIDVKNWRGETIFSEQTFLGNKLLADSKRVLHPEIELKDNLNWPGIYSTSIKINYGRTNQVVSAVAYIWYFPKWSKLFAGLVALVIIGSLIFWKLKRVRS